MLCTESSVLGFFQRYMRYGNVLNNPQILYIVILPILGLVLDSEPCGQYLFFVFS